MLYSFEGDLKEKGLKRRYQSTSPTSCFEGDLKEKGLKHWSVLS